MNLQRIINLHASFQKLLVFDPNKRINCKTCLDHPYFDEVTTHCTSQSSTAKQDKNNNKNKESEETFSSANTIEVDAALNLKTSEPGCSKKVGSSFPRVDSGIEIDHPDGCSDQRYLSRSDSGICVSPPTVDSGTSSDTVSTENDECVKNNDSNYLCAETSLLIRESDAQHRRSDEDLLKSPPRKMIRK